MPDPDDSVRLSLLNVSILFHTTFMSDHILRSWGFISASFVFVFTLNQNIKVMTEKILMLCIGLIIESHSALLIIHLKGISLCKEIAPLRTKPFYFHL